MPGLEANSPLIAIFYGAGSDASPLMRSLVEFLSAAGVRCAGFVQRDVTRPDRAKCDMVLEEIGSGRTLPISEDRGPHARGCRLDEDGLNHAITAATRNLVTEPDILILNKFGKSESEGRGFRPLIAAALEANIPVLVPVPWRNADSWRQFAAELSREHTLDALAPLSAADVCAHLGLRLLPPVARPASLQR